MRYSIGIDVAKNKFVAVIVDPKRKPLAKPRSLGNDVEGYEALLAWAREVTPAAASLQLGIEASGTYHTNLVYYLAARAPEVQLFVLNPLVVKRYGEATLRRNQTDPADARRVARLVAIEGDRLRPWKADDSQRELQRLLAERRHWVEVRTAEVNRLQALLQENFPEFPDFFHDLTHPLALLVLARHPTARAVAACRVGTLAAVRPGYPRAHSVGQARAQTLVARARQSAACGGTEAEAAMIQRAVAFLQDLGTRIAAVEAVLADYFEALPTPQPIAPADAGVWHDSQENPSVAFVAPSSTPLEVLRHEASLLKTVPAIGSLLALEICARTGSLRRFSRPDTLSAFLGTCPGRDQSGTSCDVGFLTPYGPRPLRADLLMGVQSAIVHFAPLRFYYHRLRSRGKAHRTAVFACINRVIHWAWAIVRSNEPFSESKVIRNIRQHFPAAWEEFCAADNPPKEVPTTP